MPLPEHLEATVEGEVPGPRKKPLARKELTRLVRLLAVELARRGRREARKLRQMEKLLRVMKALTLGNGLVLAGLVLLMLMVGALGRELSQSAVRVADASVELSHAVVSVVSGVQTPVVNATLGGLKMPDKPQPNWLPCPDLCGTFLHPSCTKNGEAIHAVGLRGSCWEMGANIFRLMIPPQNKPCMNGLYDPPPEAPADLQGNCFTPIIVSPPRAVEPTPSK